MLPIIHPTILYIEDYALNIQLVKRMLKFMPYQVLDATTGEQGFMLAQRHCPDLILMDINLPDTNGLDLTRLIKTDPALCHIPIVAFTSDSSRQMKQGCLDAGCDGYLNKPVSKPHLFKVLQQLLPDPTPYAN